MYEKVMVPNLVPDDLLGAGGMVEKGKLGRIFWFGGKERIVFRSAEFDIQVKMTSRLLEMVQSSNVR